MPWRRARIPASTRAALGALLLLVACSGDAVIGVVYERATQGSCDSAPQPVGILDPAGCTRSDVDPCAFSCPDEGGHVFGMRCDDHSCSCTHDGVAVCLCSVSGNGAICDGLDPCCPSPWPIP